MKQAEPRFCQTCGVNRRAKRGGRLCYDCMPGGPFQPPPCRRCGTTEDFFASGLCARCHLHGSQRVDACPDCHAWGVTRHTTWVCAPCVHWRQTYATIAACIVCATVVTVAPAGVCRLCRVQARRLRVPKQRLDFAGANRHGAQLFLVGMYHKASHTTVQAADHTPVEAVRAVRPVAHRQLVMFTMAADLSDGRGAVGPPRDAVLAEILDDAVTRFASDAGWHWTLTSKVRSGVRLVLGMQDTPGAAIGRSELGVLAQAWLPQHHVAAVLAAAGVLHDDRVPAITRWFADQTAGLPTPMTSELQTWFDIMRHGATSPPRRRPRSLTTIKVYVGATVSAIRRWAADGHESLREITRAQVLSALPTEPAKRKLYGQGMRSIFGILHSRKLIFANPAVRLAHAAESSIPPTPVDLDAVRAALDSPNPARAALVGLVAFHGLRSHQLRHLRLTDIQDRRLHLDGRVIPLAEPVGRRISGWLDHRADRWPNSTNPHLFIHTRTARRDQPVGLRWVFLTLGLPGGTRALRQDRILHEAIATGGDPRRLCDLFGLSIHHATRYTDAVTEPPDPYPATDG